MVQLKKFDMTVNHGGEYGLCDGVMTDKAVHAKSTWLESDVTNVNRWLGSSYWLYEEAVSVVLPSELMS